MIDNKSISSIPLHDVNMPNADLTNRRTAMRVLSWNIHDLSEKDKGPKTEDMDFMKIFDNCPIFCLQETKGNISIPDYECKNKLRKGSRSGGLCIGVHRSFAQRFKELDTECEDIQAVTVSLGTNNSTGDVELLTIINVYDSQEESSFKKRKKASADAPETTLESLMNFVAKQNLGKVLLMGDFNARTNNLNHIAVVDEFGDNLDAIRTKFTLPEHQRASRDKKINKRGKLFMDFITSVNLTILNGSVVGDIFGEFTSVNYNGSSVVDYTCVSQDLLDQIISFTVGELTMFSDHKPCFCTLQIKNDILLGEDILDSLEDAPVRYKWDDNNSLITKAFYEAQEDESTKQKLTNLVNITCVNENDVGNLNKEIIGIYQEIANKIVPSKTKTHNIRRKFTAKQKKKRGRMRPKLPWFDAECINSKRELNRLANCYGKNPTNTDIRTQYYSKRKCHKNLIKTKKRNFIGELTRDIEHGNNIEWSRFKKLKAVRKKGTSLDVFDLLNFSKFFKNLYVKKNLAIESEINEVWSSNAEQTDTTPTKTDSEFQEVLDKDITIDELKDAIDKLKLGKAVSEDLIANEFLKASGPLLREALLLLFNDCLRLGCYPWNISYVTPLHKKGNIYDPNNYRAIAVASNVGKLFSNILLKRLLDYRAKLYPDTKNQLGFCKNAQTSDHILTLSTCINKYVNHSKNGRLYTCFVDFAKAFDTISREALLYKLWQMGIQGRFFSCLKHMYSNSCAKIKLLNKLSERIDILCGTEQGHPLSPELFKCYIQAMSEEFNEGFDDSGAPENVPSLNNVKVSHLLWADDLVLMAQDMKSLQKMINVLHKYCGIWGLTVNMDKTAVMVYNKSGRILKDSQNFFFGDSRIQSVREYCYLGITFSLTGSLALTQQKLRQKGLRSYFSLKSMIDVGSLRKTVLFKLFDSLILPVAGYGCQVWLPETMLFKNITNTDTSPSLQAISKDPLEKLHLSFLKWSMGVHKKTSNSPVWGDTGRYPLGIELSKQLFSYFDRLQSLDMSNSDSLVRHAFCEQRSLNLRWYSGLTTAKTYLSNQSSNNFPSQLRSSFREKFVEKWQEERQLNSKLSFYNTVKEEFNTECYLNIWLSREETRRLAQIRTSSHQLRIETGRYGTRRMDITNRTCQYCSSQDEVFLLSKLPFFDPILEDENHVLNICPLYDHARRNIKHNTRTLIGDGNFQDIFKNPLHAKETARFLSRCHKLRESEHE